MGKKEYSIELEKLLHDLEERPGTLLQDTNKLDNKIAKLSSKERGIWFDHLKEFRAAFDKFQKLTVDKDFCG